MIKPIRSLFTLVILLAAAALPALAQSPSSCAIPCGQGLRACLLQGRPAMRDCLRPCRDSKRAAVRQCPEATPSQDCPELDQARLCYDTCREVRRAEVRQCLDAAGQCLKDCRAGTPSPS